MCAVGLFEAPAIAMLEQQITLRVGFPPQIMHVPGIVSIVCQEE